MNATARYILTATAVGAGLFTVGAAANAIAGGTSPDAAPIGDPVVVPSSSPAAALPPTLVEEVPLEPVDLGPIRERDREGWDDGLGDTGRTGAVEIEDGEDSGGEIEDD